MLDWLIGRKRKGAATSRTTNRQEAAVPEDIESSEGAKPAPAPAAVEKPKRDPCAELRAAKAEADAAAAALIDENERLRKAAATPKDDCGCGEHEACLAEATAGFRNLARAMRKAINS